MVPHDPFGSVFSYLGLPGVDNGHIRIRNRIGEIQEHYRENRFDLINYSDPLDQAAYLLSYYLLYIDPIDDVLSTVLRSITDQESQQRPVVRGVEDKQRVEVSVYGGGPEPELLGLLKFFGREFPTIDSVKSNYVDYNDWSAFRKFAHDRMIPGYWGKEYISGEDLRLDLRSLYQDPRAMAAIRRSDVHIMQNCGSELMYEFGSTARYQQFMCKIYHNMKPGSLLIGIEIPLFGRSLPTNPYDKIDVRSSFNRFANWLRSRPEAGVLKSPDGLYRVIKPDIVRDHMYFNYFEVKSSVKFQSFVVRKGD